MRMILLSSLSVALLLAVVGCKGNGSGDSMGSMKMDDKATTKPATTMPSGMQM